MLTIRDAQIEAFREALLPTLVGRTVSYLREHYPSTTARWADDDLQATVARSLERAHGYGLTWESSLVCFAVLAVEIGPAFDRHPRIRAALVDDTCPPDERLSVAHKLATEADWQEARALGVAHDDDPFALTPVEAAHAPSLAALLRDLGPEGPRPDDVAAWVARAVDARATGREFAFAITLPAEVVAGTCAVRVLDGQSRVGELSYWVGRPFQNRGHATTAVRRVAAFGFGRLGLATLEAAVVEKNTASRRVLERCGASIVARRASHDDERAVLVYQLNEPRYHAIG